MFVGDHVTYKGAFQMATAIVTQGWATIANMEMPKYRHCNTGMGNYR